MTDAVFIRPAILSDAAACVGLSAQLGYEKYLDHFQARFSNILGKEDHAIFVAVKDEKIMGWMHLYIRPYLQCHDRVQLAAMVVDETCRSHGIGAQMLKCAEQWTRQKGIEEIILSSDVKRELAHAFYAKNGFVNEKTSKIFYKRVKDN